MLLLFLEAVKVFAAGAETVLEILDLVAESCDVLGLSLKVDGGEGVGEVMGLDVRLEVIELDQRGVHVGLYRGSGFFELLDVGIHQLELLEHLDDEQSEPKVVNVAGNYNDIHDNGTVNQK